MKKNILILLILTLLLFINVNTVGAETYTNYDKDAITSCGNGKMKNIPQMAPKVIKIGYTVIQIIVPVTLVITGSLDLMKGVVAQKEDEIKKGQQIFIKRLISAGLIFFVFVIVKLVISFAADSSDAWVMECADCFLTGNCD